MRRSKGLVTLDDVRTHLKGQDKQALVDILMEGAMGDDRLRQRLMMKTAAKAPKSVGLATYRRAIDEAVDEEVIDSIEELLKDDRAAEVIELAEHALEAVEDAMGSVDDSDGDLGGVLDRLQEIHHQACKRAMPDRRRSPSACSSGSLARLRHLLRRRGNRKNNEAYREAIGLLRKVRELMIRLDQEFEFPRYVESVRAAHKPKRNFMKLLDGAKWS